MFSISKINKQCFCVAMIVLLQPWEPPQDQFTTAAEQQPTCSSIPNSLQHQQDLNWHKILRFFTTETIFYLHTFSESMHTNTNSIFFIQTEICFGVQIPLQNLVIEAFSFLLSTIPTLSLFPPLLRQLIFPYDKTPHSFAPS